MNWINGRPEDWANPADKTGDYPFANGFGAGANTMLSALIAWLEEPCDKHRILEDDQSVQTYISDRAKYVIRYERHRKDCPQCWQELKEKI